MTGKYRIRNYVDERVCDPIWYTTGTHKFLQKSIQPLTILGSRKVTVQFPSWGLKILFPQATWR